MARNCVALVNTYPQQATLGAPVLADFVGVYLRLSVLVLVCRCFGGFRFPGFQRFSVFSVCIGFGGKFAFERQATAWPSSMPIPNR